jgi:hypothetical protein
MTTDSQTSPGEVQKPRMGRVFLDFGYYVDLNNAEMVQEAKQALWEDVMNAFKYGETHLYVEVEDAPNASEDDISDFLLGEPEEEESEEDNEA